MTLVVPEGQGSFELCAAALAREMSCEVWTTRHYDEHIRPYWGRRASTLRQDIAFVRELNNLPRPLHLTNQHFARYVPFLKPPVVVTVHDTVRFDDMRRRTPLIARPTLRERRLLLMDVWGLRRASAVIAVSEDTRRCLAQNWSVGSHVVHNGLDHETFRPLRGPDMAEPYLLFVGTEQRRKNFPAAVETLRILREEKPDRQPDLPLARRMRLLKVGGPGSGDREASLRAVEGAGMEEHVTFLGRVSEEELVELYNGAQALLMPTLHEGFGLPLAEAMACGCPVVASDRGAVPEVVGNAGCTVEPEPHLLARAVIHTLERRPAISMAAVERSRRFSWLRAAEETQAVYRSLGYDLGRGRGLLPLPIRRARQRKVHAGPGADQGASLQP